MIGFLVISYTKRRLKIILSDEKVKLLCQIV